MANILLLSPVLSDAATMVASSTASAGLPVTQLQYYRPDEKWRATGDTAEYVEVDMGSAVACNTLALIGHNLSASATLRLRGKATYPVTSSPTVDTGAVSAWPASGKPTEANWPHYLSLLTWNSAPLRYWRLDIADASNPANYVQAGRLMIGAKWQPTGNFDYGGVPLAYVPPDQQTVMPGGQRFTERRALSPARQIGVQFSALSSDDVRTGIGELHRHCGGWRDVVCCIDSAANADFHLLSMHGLFDPATVPRYPTIPQFDASGVPMYSAQLALNELI